MVNRVAINGNSNYFTVKPSRQLSDARVTAMRDGDRRKATHMGIWDRIKDFFRTEKKQEALNALYEAIHGSSSEEESDSSAEGHKKSFLICVEAFNRLELYAGEGCKHLFKRDIDQEGVMRLSIDDHEISTWNLKNMLGVGGGQGDEEGFHDCMIDYFKDRYGDLKDIYNGFNSGWEQREKIDFHAKLNLLHAFKEAAGPINANRFSTIMDDENNIFWKINDDLLIKSSMTEILGVGGEKKLQPMNRKELDLFESMLVFVDNYKIKDYESLSEVRDEMVKDNKIIDEMYSVYRNLGERGEEAKEWGFGKKEGNDYILVDHEKKENKEFECYKDIREINYGTFSWGTMFSKIGYKNNNSGGVDFSMVHPSIAFMIGMYIPEKVLVSNEEDGEDIKINTLKLFGVYNNSYEFYLENKVSIDRTFYEVYKKHGDTLFVKLDNESRNKLI